ncbi:ABC transporter substrate-binding protein [Loktanella sp. IMCC34160]|uniref:ABC transporter substrate-binding protein n=1 Tax=Loktanella sp. IMCC34160 TaxID=2510646 RepID=UPI00101DEAFE|nr:ABC transporter substrate-binding protein [Loktanella sp. IMCC34160]RYG89691.1 ABC transporter substrate-binding protein [Loktanella sp. IMCC34160]
MRRTIAALVIAFCVALPRLALGFDVEEEQVFPAPSGAPTAPLRILSTTDTEIFAPLLDAFQADNPDVPIHYTVASTQEVYKALHDEGAAFDLAVSSAMDLQMKLANDGFALSHRSAPTQALPGWARWRDQLFAFAQEPVVMIASARAFDGPLPRTRSDLIRALRDRPEAFDGRIGTYDPNRSGAGYLFATQDARQSDTYWRLSEVMGGLSPRLYDTTGAMIADVQSGKLALAYNVLGSYAEAQLDPDGDARIVAFEDFTHVLLRTALIPRTAPNPDAAGAFVDFLLSGDGQRLIASETGLPPISEAALAADPYLRPIRLDPGLLVFVDPLKRQRFLNEWTAAVVQP